MHKVLLLGILLTACGKKAGDAADPPPPQPANGAPIAFVTKGFKAGESDGSVTVKGYNFSDKTIAQYMFLVRYYDKGGAVLKVKKGTPFEKDTDFMSMSGKKYACAPKAWCTLTIDMLSVPTETAKADVIAKRVTALKDGTSFEDKPLFEMQGDDWPTSK